MLFRLLVCQRIFFPVGAAVPSALTAAKALERGEPPQLTDRGISYST